MYEATEASKKTHKDIPLQMGRVTQGRIVGTSESFKTEVVEAVVDELIRLLRKAHDETLEQSGSKRSMWNPASDIEVMLNQYDASHELGMGMGGVDFDQLLRGIYLCALDHDVYAEMVGRRSNKEGGE
jgi:hypothetical protein